MSDAVLGIITVVFYLVAVPIGIGAYTHGALWLAVLVILALPLLAIALFLVTIIASLIVSVWPTRLV